MSELTVQPIQAYDLSFSSQQNRKSDVPYYKSNLGVTTGALLSIPAAIDFLPDLKLRNSDNFEKTILKYEKDLENGKNDIDKIIADKEIPEFYKNFLKKYKTTLPDAQAYRKICERRSKIAIPATLIATGCTIGGGALVDAVRNKKARETAEKVAYVQNEGAAVNIRNASVAQSGMPYHRSAAGKALGPLLGAACGALSAYLNGGTAKNKINLIFRIIGFTAGGFATGSIYDNIVNKRAERVANNII